MYALFINRVLIKNKAGVNKSLIRINNNTNNLTELMHFIQIKRLV